MIKSLYSLVNKLLMREEITVAAHERALVFRQGRLLQVLLPGVYYFPNPLGDLTYDVYDVNSLEFNSPLADMLRKEYPEIVAQHFFATDVLDQQVGMLFEDGHFSTIVLPATRKLYWKAFHTLSLELMDISDSYEIPAEKLQQFMRIKNPTSFLCQIVPEASVGLLFVNGKLERTLPPGVYGFWKFGRDIRCETIDTRLQQTDISGQELLTKDRISLRITLTCWFVVTDPVKARTSVSNYTEHLYKELQFGLREAVGGKTLDELLDDKEAINPAILNTARPKMAEIGIDLRSLGVKDLILPGDMRELVNKVIEAKKLAEANLIKRREETAATRSLLNTAKLMEDSPTLMRLKELETLEKLTEQIQTLHVYSGFNQLLTELVSLKTPAIPEKKE